MEKAFALPLVNATYDSLASLSTPLQVFLLLILIQYYIYHLLLQPFAEKGAALISSMGESYGAIKAGVHDKVGQCAIQAVLLLLKPSLTQVPDSVSAKVTDAKGQVDFEVASWFCSISLFGSI